MSVTLTFTVTEEHHYKPAKLFLRQGCGISAHTLIKLKQTPLGITRGGRLLRVIDLVSAGDVITVCLPKDENEIIPIKMDLDIVYEDDHVLVVNKPFLMPVHPTGDHLTDTLANGVAHYMRQKGEFYSFRALNRLDRDTTGLVLLAKHSYAAFALCKGVEKTYYAVCEGVVEQSGRIEAPISLMEGHTIQRQAGQGGVFAATNYTVQSSANGHTLLAVELETGRTHQIRVHMSHIGHPLAGDDMYGGSLTYISRQALHCGACSFIHPVSKKRIHLTVDIPWDMKNVMQCTKGES